MPIELKGKYGTAKIFTNKIEQGALLQVQEQLEQSWTKDLKIRVMPDVHVGFGVPIGYTQTITNTLIPNFVGVDIGCGMLVSKLSNYDDYKINFHRLDKAIRDNVPAGFNIHKNRKTLSTKIEDMIAPINIDRAYKSVGTLGGGNHFIEVNKSDKGIYLVIHSGSRHLGVEVCNYWTKQIPKNTGYLEGKDFDGYLHDMKLAQSFASENRKAMRDNIFKAMNWDLIDSFETIHNYIDMKHMILRKGAISARLDEVVIIPINMRDGSLIAKGLGNADWNQSAPHGAGRIMSRTEAKKTVRLKDFQASMSNIWSTSVSNRTLDESPFVYKPIDEILENTKDTMVILERLEVLYNFKA